MKIRISLEAEQDLIEIFDYILADNPLAADKTLDVIYNEIRHLGEHPYLGRAGRVSGTRELVLSGAPYVVPYRVKKNTLEILRVYHSARKWPDGLIRVGPV